MTNRRKWKRFKKSQKVKNYNHGYLNRLLDKAMFWKAIDDWGFLRFW